MIACAASAWPDGLSASTAWMMPAETVRGSSETPMTPVEATSTSSASQPSARAVSAAISSATLSPASPVHALAQPLLTTIAHAWPPVASRCSRDTMTGAATALLTVNTPAALAGRVEATTATSLPLALMPQ
jgi:hypothetical protein